MNFQEFSALVARCVAHMDRDSDMPVNEWVRELRVQLEAQIQENRLMEDGK